MRIVILGGNGQIGRVIFSELKKEKNWEVIGTSRLRKMDSFCFDPFQDDWSKLGKVDVIINAVGQIISTKKYSFEKIHIELVQLILKNRIVIGSPRIIHISALGASPNHEIDFLKTKGQADEYLYQAENAIVLKPSIICTHRTTMVRKMQMLYKYSRFFGGIIFVPKNFLDHATQPVMPADLAEIIKISCVAERLPKSLDVVGPDRITYRKLIDILFQERKKKYRLVQLPKKIVDFFIRFFIYPFFPSIITWQQYQALFKDNISDVTKVENYIGHPTQSTVDFWKKELGS